MKMLSRSMDDAVIKHLSVVMPGYKTTFYKHSDRFYYFLQTESCHVKRKCNSQIFSLKLISKTVQTVYLVALTYNALHANTYLRTNAQNSTRPKLPVRLLSGHCNWAAVCVKYEHSHIPQSHHSGWEGYEKFWHVCWYNTCRLAWTHTLFLLHKFSSSGAQVPFYISWVNLSQASPFP